MCGGKWRSSVSCESRIGVGDSLSTNADGLNMIVPTTVMTKRADTCTGHCFICGDSWMRGIAGFFFFF